MDNLVDLAVVNAWLQYRTVQAEKGIPRKNFVKLREYKLNLGTKLLTDNEESDDGGEHEEYDELEPKHKKRNSYKANIFQGKSYKSCCTFTGTWYKTIAL